ncbi:RT1 class I histocompatibility antigen, AA alpha chain-like [Alligator mississippiensis]|uniref:RT1 class I histocompatibility antigen, AA alpha chain-like n=1 Tax=Alligator mississippiensis TaxID=8496 RepID=A0A151P0Z5_ALLMI|nr:RT1 class I histocompatibility antigen, AA alpha chain-like [Alligator mississippiensis]
MRASREQDPSIDSSRSNQLPRRAANNMANPAERHFINSFRKDLINMTREVNQVIDELFDNGVLSQEQYDTIRSKSTKQEQMRELYDYVAGWDEESKDQLYEALRKYNEPLIRKLRGTLQARGRRAPRGGRDAAVPEPGLEQSLSGAGTSRLPGTAAEVERETVQFMNKKLALAPCGLRHGPWRPSLRGSTCNVCAQRLEAPQEAAAKKLLLLLVAAVAVPGTSAGSHSYRHLYTAVSDPSPDVPHFTAVSYMDDQQILHYDSETQRQEPRGDWVQGAVDQDFWEGETMSLRAWQRGFKRNLRTLQYYYNQTEAGSSCSRRGREAVVVSGAVSHLRQAE